MSRSPLRLEIIALFASIVLVASPLRAQIPFDAVNAVSQSQYETYQLTVQDMGLGLYGGSEYDQGYRNRYNSGGSASESLGFQEANLYLTDQLTAMGLSVSSQSDYRNVIGELTGTQTPERIFIVGGHYDHPQFDADAPGGDDNASGTAGMLEAARVLSRYQFKSTIRFIAWGGEEGQMLGSKDYVENVVVAGGENIVAMLNLDMIIRPGWDSDANQLWDVDISTGTDANCQALANSFMAAGAEYAPSLLFDSRNPQTTNWWPGDQGPFIQAGFAGIMIAENTADEIWNQGAHDYYHTLEDASDMAAGDLYDYAFATDIVRTTVGLLAEQAEIIPEPATLLVMTAAGLPLLLKRRRRRKKAA